MSKYACLQGLLLALCLVQVFGASIPETAELQDSRESMCYRKTSMPGNFKCKADDDCNWGFPLGNDVKDQQSSCCLVCDVPTETCIFPKQTIFTIRNGRCEIKDPPQI